MSADRTAPRRVPRDLGGTASVEAFLIVAITTILVTRLYLALAGYPQVGGGTLHIAHALWGGVAMVAALLMGWMFLGLGTRTAAVVTGGVGFGLFLDEVGKFVTKDNDYFYGPSAEIMYITVLVVLLAGRAVRRLRPPSAEEFLANAAATAASGVARGLAPHRRADALDLLDRAAARGADPGTVAAVRVLIEGAGHRRDRLHAARQRAPRLVPAPLASPRWGPAVGWALVAAAAGALWLGTAQLLPGGFEVDVRAATPAAADAATWIYLASAAVTLGLALPAVLRLRRGGPVWPLRALRTAALVFTVLNALVEFALDGFWALTHVAAGLLAMAVLSYQLRLREGGPGA